MRSDIFGHHIDLEGCIIKYRNLTHKSWAQRAERPLGRLHPNPKLSQVLMSYKKQLSGAEDLCN